MLTIGCAQQVWAGGNSTSTPSRVSRSTTARPVSGNIASFTQVTINATRMRPIMPVADLGSSAAAGLRTPRPKPA